MRQETIPPRRRNKIAVFYKSRRSLVLDTETPHNKNLGVLPARVVG